MTKAKTHAVTLIPGDGIGPEVTDAVIRILDATGVKFAWERYAAGAEAFEKVKDNYKKTAILARVADSDEIAKSVVFLATPDSYNITGETLLTDGGLRLSIAGLRG